MAEILYLRDTVTGKQFTEGEVEYFNSEVGQVATLDVVYDYAVLRDTLDRDALRFNTDPTIWRYRDMLPLDPDSPVPPLAVGG
ncbi:MAG: hypothetical protein AAFV33_09285, partial [Chloroflexota bacterium]